MHRKSGEALQTQRWRSVEGMKGKGVIPRVLRTLNAYVKKFFFFFSITVDIREYSIEVRHLCNL